MLERGGYQGVIKIDAKSAATAPSYPAGRTDALVEDDLYKRSNHNAIARDKPAAYRRQVAYGCGYLVPSEGSDFDGSIYAAAREASLIVERARLRF